MKNIERITKFVREYRKPILEAGLILLASIGSNLLVRDSGKIEEKCYLRSVYKIERNSLEDNYKSQTKSLRKNYRANLKELNNSK